MLIPLFVFCFCKYISPTEAGQGGYDTTYTLIFFSPSDTKVKICDSVIQ